MTLTTKSESVPVVETFRSTEIGPKNGKVLLEHFGFVNQNVRPGFPAKR